eukprot:15333389-Ditylum_brightwellii.AAC.1
MGPGRCECAAGSIGGNIIVVVGTNGEGHVLQNVRHMIPQLASALVFHPFKPDVQLVLLWGWVEYSTYGRSRPRRK